MPEETKTTETTTDQVHDRCYSAGDRVRILPSRVMIAAGRAGIEFVVSQVAEEYLIGHDDAGQTQVAPKRRVEPC